MKAYGQQHPTNNTFEINASVIGEPIEKRVERIMNNNEPITDGAPLIYTDRKDGVDPIHNVRTDRFEVALEMTDTIAKQALAKRKEFHDNLTQQNTPTPTPTKIDPIPGQQQ